MRWREEGVYLGSFGDFDPLVHNLLLAMNHCFARVALPQSLSIQTSVLPGKFWHRKLGLKSVASHIPLALWKNTCDARPKNIQPIDCMILAGFGGHSRLSSKV